MKIKCYTVVSPSHRALMEKYMLPSFPNNPNMEMTIKYIPQLCPTSEFESSGWHSVMREKAKCFYDSLVALQEDELMMFIDTDIYHAVDWYSDMLTNMIDVDLAIQNDYGGGLNTGFFCARRNPVTENLFKAIFTYIDNFSNEQKAMTEFCLKHKQYEEIRDLRWKFLPPKYWTYGENHKHFDGTDDFGLPSDCHIVHCNWTKSFALKTILCDLCISKLR